MILPLASPPCLPRPGAANKDYVHSLGADQVFDYKDPHVVDAIVSAAKDSGLEIRHCFLGTGELALCQAVLKAFVAFDQEGKLARTAKLASAPVVPADAEVADGIETIFVMPSTEEEERLRQFQYWLGTWLRTKLIEKAIKPSPELKVVGTSLEAINTGLDMLRDGVSCAKLVVEVAQ